MTTGGGEKIQGLISTEIVFVFPVSLLVLLRECRSSKPTDTLTVPEGLYKIKPLFTTISPSGAVKEVVCVWKGNIQQRN